MTVRPATWVMAAAAVGAAWLVHADPWRAEGAGPSYVTNHGATLRLVPTLTEGVPGDLVIELVRPGGLVTRIAPGDGGGPPWVWDDGVSLGPADPEAVDGLWSTLRGATSLRAATGDTEAGLGEAGRIRVRGGGHAFEIVLGRPTPDGVGVYGALVDDAAVWVVERQLADLAAQLADAWVARRPLLLDVAEVTRIDFADASLERGPDRLWRAQVGDVRALLSNTAVEARLGRLLGARLEPWRDPWIDPAAAPPPWIRLHTGEGPIHALWQGAACDDGKVAVDRGAGRAGCIDARLLDPWPLPGREGSDGAWIEPQLLPHAYGRVLRIEQQTPQTMTLRRDGGGWVIERGVDEIITVGEPEVFRWYEAVRGARLRTDAPVELAAVSASLRVTTDSTAQVQLRCGPVRDGDGLACARDEQPAYAVALDVPLGFGAETFTDRQLTTVDAGEARAIEIAGEAVVRQGAHLDLGVWRLDAPAHPEGDGALDEQRVLGLLSTVAGLRALEWTPAPAGPPLRSLRVELVPSGGRPPAIEVDLWPGCIVQVDGGTAARIAEGSCKRLGEALLVDAPLERAIEDARALELVIAGRRHALVRRDGLWTRADGEPAGEVAEPLRRWPQLVASSLVPGPPPGRVAAELAVEPTAGEPYVLEVGDGWARIRGEAWHYALRPRTASPAFDDDVPALSVD